MIPIKKTQTGFALLITLLMISVVIAVTLSILELSLKQLQLSVNSTDSEIAFQAANAGMECVQRARRIHSAAIEVSPSNFNLRCFDKTTQLSPDTNSIPIESGNSNGTVVRYKGDVEWGAGVDIRCSQIDMIAVMADDGDIVIGGSGANSLKRRIPNYDSDTKKCQQGAKCTIASVAGYGSPCSQKTGLGTLKREILLEF